MAAQLEIKDLAKTYGQGDKAIEVLSSINITVGQDQLVVLIGPNGCGKSTLLKIIAGIIEPTSGTITRAGQLAYLPQQPSLLPWRTVEQNLLLPSDVRRTSTIQAKNKARKLLKDFGLLEFASFYPRALSGGTQQKVALLRAVIAQPSLLLLDEPFAALDAITRLELQKWLLELKRKISCGVVCVTHDIPEAIFLADTIYVLSKRPGHIKQKFSKAGEQAHPKSLDKKLYELLVNAP